MSQSRKRNKPYRKTRRIYRMKNGIMYMKIHTVRLHNDRAEADRNHALHPEAN